jgi:hypothetical protein
MNNNNLDGP